MNYQERVCSRITQNSDNGMEDWQWGQGVALYGLITAYKTNRDTTNLEYVRNWLDTRLSAGGIGISINTTAPLLSALEIWELTGDTKYADICRTFAEWCVTSAPRSERGTFEHSCTENVYPNQIWADTLFMGCLFLAKYGVLTGQNMYIDEAMRQFILHYKFLSDTQTGLIYHGYYANERKQKGVLWGRGNGWFSVASAIILDWVSPDHPHYKTVRENFARHTNGLLKYQRDDGAWNTVIDDPESYSEMSATAAFAFGLKKAVESGVISNSYSANVDSAYNCLKQNIESDGTVAKSSDGTCVMDDKNAYNAIGYRYSPFAQGLAMLIL